MSVVSRLAGMETAEFQKIAIETFHFLLMPALIGFLAPALAFDALSFPASDFM